MNILRQNLAYLMDMHQLSANALAQASGASQPTISRILSGESSDPRVQSLQPIAEYFKMDLEDLRGKLIEGADTIQLVGSLSTTNRPPASQRQKNILRPRFTSWMVSGGVYGDSIATFENLLPDGLKTNLRNDGLRIPLFGARRFFNYQSEIAIAEIRGAYFYKKDGKYHHTFNTEADQVKSTLWDMLCMKTRTQLHYPGQRFFIFYFFRDLESDEIASYIDAPREFTELMGEAAEHGIAVIQTTPEIAATIIEESERAHQK